ncbi:hypothetical protein DUNSADRAFT_8665 [Dunaliella salina]|uniref:Secreted protein n=1 Tax=Dunaliella salina TaxID=3046 RepID=A0ABQ7GJ61_DUNSA|nr:hypothetical protein DUNSADRAFT_8665 [Dunaliella salina]|eukprot:KAF5834624.1 hypothetical protein DUNSADRAFT_8665 [Dunaliella salina]
MAVSCVGGGWISHVFFMPVVRGSDRPELGKRSSFALCLLTQHLAFRQPWSLLNATWFASSEDGIHLRWAWCASCKQSWAWTAMSTTSAVQFCGSTSFV